MMDDIQKSIENWEEKDINKQCYDFMLREYFLFSLVGVVSSLSVIVWVISSKSVIVWVISSQLLEKDNFGYMTEC